jgi:hypothetical protein
VSRCLDYVNDGIGPGREHALIVVGGTSLSASGFII